MLNSSNDFFSTNGIMVEPCEAGTCNVDQRSFKAYFARELAATAELAPFTHDAIMVHLKNSATAAIKTCTGGTTGTKCGLKWTTGANDGSIGVGEQMAVLEIVQSNMIDQAPGWASAVKGTGTSTGNVNAGGTAKNTDGTSTTVVTTADRVGAGFLTALVVCGVAGASFLMCWGE